MKRWFGIAMLWLGLNVSGMAASYYATNNYPYSPAAGQVGSAAVYLSSNAIVAWADGYENLVYGLEVLPIFQTPEKALGPAVGGSFDIVCLGRGGQITLTFSGGIENGDGADFVVFENGFSDTFLELGWVEVSSDGTNFVRYPNYSLNTSSVLDPQKIYGLAGKYRHSYGAPFDLEDFQIAYNAALEGNTDFGPEYMAQLTNGFPLLDLDHITHVRIVDVIGSGTAAFDCRDIWQIYDPYPMADSAGFDLDAIGVINQPSLSGAAQVIFFEPIPHQKLAFGSLQLTATADSGLPVSYAVESGPAVLAGTELSFTGTGVVEVVASQLGNETYAPAAPVLRAFRVAEEIQHIFVEPLPNQIQNSDPVQVYAYSSRGLPVQLEVFDGPPVVAIGATNHVLELADAIGVVTLRAFQPGDATTAPAKEVFIDFSLVEAGATNAPLTLAAWAGAHSVPTNGWADSDADGVLDIQEFILGGDPNNPSDSPKAVIGHTTDGYGRPVVVLEYSISRRALGRARWSGSTNLVDWNDQIPEIKESSGNSEVVALKICFPVEEAHGFFRLVFE